MKLVRELQHAFIVKFLVCKPFTNGRVVDFLHAGLGALEVLTTLRISGGHVRAQFGGTLLSLGILAMEKSWSLQPTP